jgi:putative transposase
MLVGWQIDDNMEEDLSISPFQKALNQPKPAAGLIVHSHRAGQYVATNFRKLLAQHHCLPSMSRADNPYDNAESFFSRFKAERLEEGAFIRIEDARTQIFEWIEL